MVSNSAVYEYILYEYILEPVLLSIQLLSKPRQCTNDKGAFLAREFDYS